MPAVRKVEWLEDVDDVDESGDYDSMEGDPSEDGEPVVMDTPLQTLGSIFRSASTALDASKPRA